MVVRRLPQMAVGTEKGSPFQHAGKALLLWGKVHPARTTLRHAKQVPRVPQVPDNRAPELSLLPQHSDDDRLRPAGCKVRWQPVSASLARETKIKKPRAAVALGLLPFPRLRRANLTANQSGSTWRDQGDKMARSSI
jgi:hypothetical protein